MSQFYPVLARGVVGCATALVLTGCQMMATGSAGSSASAIYSGADPLVLDERMKGELTTGSAINVKDGSRYQLYRLSLEPGDLVAVDLQGSFEGMLSLYDAENTLLMVDSPLRIRAEEGGEYAVVVSGETSDSYGPFSITASSIDLNDTGVLQVPGTTRGWLQSELRVYTLTVEKQAAYQIDVLSSDFDSVMAIEGPDGYYNENDDGSESGNASISDMFAPGEYTLTIGSYEGRQGLFDIEIATFEVDVTDTDVLTPGSEIEGWMGEEPESYSLTIEEEGEYQVEMRSTTLDSFLVIEGPDGFYAEDDDGGQHYNSRIVETLNPGVYQVSASRHPEAYPNRGVFTLSAERR